MKRGSILVVFAKELPQKTQKWWRRFDVVVTSKGLQSAVQGYGLTFVDIEGLIGAGNIYEASAFAEELSHLKLADGSRITKSFLYKGYELWWIHYSNLFLYFCLPYTQYKKLLEYLKSFSKICFYQPAHKSLFFCYLQAHGCEVSMLHKAGLRRRITFPLGILLQIAITLLSLSILILKKRRVMVFTGDKFEKYQDYDFRMKFIYERLRQRKILFVEFIRSLESWKIVFKHAIKRKRPVIYYEGVAFVGRFISTISGGHVRAKRKFDVSTLYSETDPDTRFKSMVATQYLFGVYDDIWAIRIMKWVLRVIGVRVAFITAASERNFHTVLGCKLNAIPMVGILHGATSRFYTVYEFMPGFDGKKSMSVDKYGTWSKWWKEYFLKNSKTYKPDQLYISGLMRPLLKNNDFKYVPRLPGDIIRVLFVSEEAAVPQEVLPYLNELLQQENIELTIKFRPYRDGFEEWLLENKPHILESDNIKIVRGNIQEAIRNCDITVGAHSTAVLEAVIQLKTPIFFRTMKWGDYYNIKEYNKERSFFSESPVELIKKIKNAHIVSVGTIKDLQERYFGDPHRNGSKWVVDQIEQVLKRSF